MHIFCKFPTLNISKLNFWLVIYIAKDFIWTTLKVIFSIFIYFLHPQIPDFSLSQPNMIVSLKPYINGKIIYLGFRLRIKVNFKKCTLITGPGSHLPLNYIYYYFTFHAFSRRFYPKRLTIAFRLYIFISMCVPWESNPQPFALLMQCSTTGPQRNTFILKIKL